MATRPSTSASISTPECWSLATPIRGLSSSYVVDGALELSVDGQGTRTFKTGDGFQVPTRTPHSGKNGDKPTVLAITYVVEKGKPLASPA